MSKSSNEYSWALYDSVEQIDARDWDAVVDDDHGIDMDRRLIRSFEATMQDQCRCWTLLLRDEAGLPMAVACLCLFQVDALDTTSELARRIVNRVRVVWRGFLRFRVLFCGLPVPAGHHHLRIAPQANATTVMRTLDNALRQLARREKARLIVFKEFRECECSQVGELRELGYLRGEVPPAHELELEAGSLDDYCNLLKSRYRWQVNRSIQRLRESGSRVSHLCDPRQIEAAFSDEVHALYRAVWDRSQYRLELLPPQFFRELARRFGEQASLTLIRHGQRIVGFTFCLLAESKCYNMYSGLDYSLNEEADIYFNLFYHSLDHGLRSGARAFHLGQTSDHFKSRLGTTQQLLYYYVRAVNPVAQYGLRMFSKYILPPVPKVPAHDVFRTTERVG